MDSVPWNPGCSRFGFLLMGGSEGMLAAMDSWPRTEDVGPSPSSLDRATPAFIQNRSSRSSGKGPPLIRAPAPRSSWVQGPTSARIQRFPCPCLDPPRDVPVTFPAGGAGEGSDRQLFPSTLRRSSWPFSFGPWFGPILGTYLGPYFGRVPANRHSHQLRLPCTHWRGPNAYWWRPHQSFPFRREEHHLPIGIDAHPYSTLVNRPVMPPTHQSQIP